MGHRIKRTALVSVSKGFHRASADLAADQRILVYAAEREIPFGEGGRAMPLMAALRKLREEDRAG